jgi:hypothetical protein
MRRSTAIRRRRAALVLIPIAGVVALIAIVIHQDRLLYLAAGVLALAILGLATTRPRTSPPDEVIAFERWRRRRQLEAQDISTTISTGASTVRLAVAARIDADTVAGVGSLTGTAGTMPVVLVLRRGRRPAVPWLRIVGQPFAAVEAVPEGFAVGASVFATVHEGALDLVVQVAHPNHRPPPAVLNALDAAGRPALVRWAPDHALVALAAQPKSPRSLGRVVDAGIAILAAGDRQARRATGGRGTSASQASAAAH